MPSQFGAWCGQHKSHPNDCFDLHHPEIKLLEARRRRSESSEKCEHDIAYSEECTACHHVFLQELNASGEELNDAINQSETQHGDGPPSESDSGQV